MGQDCCAQRHPQRSSLAQVNRYSQRLSFQREKQLSKNLNEIEDDYIVKDTQQYLQIDEKKREDQPLFKKVQSQSIIEEEIQVIEQSNANKPETLFEGNSESKDNLERQNQLEDQQTEIQIQMNKAAAQIIEEEEKQLTRSSITKHLVSNDNKSEIKSIEAPEPQLIEKNNIIDSLQKVIASNVQGQQESKEQKSQILKQIDVYKAQEISLEEINIENKCQMTDGKKQYDVSNSVPLVIEEEVLSQTQENQSQIIEKNAQSNNRAYETSVSQVLKSSPIEQDYVQNNQPEIAVPLEQISFSTNFNTVQSQTSNIEQRLKNKMQPGKLNLRFLRALEQQILGKEINQKEEEPIIQVIERPIPKNIRPRKNIKLVI